MGRPNQAVPTSIEDLAEAYYNPRSMKDVALHGLGESLGEFGDLSGIVWNLRFRRLVCGHQRVKALKAKYGVDKLSIYVPGPTEEEDGLPQIMIHGITNSTEKRFPIRVVDWPLEVEMAANLAANHPGIQGVFTDGLRDVMVTVNEKLPQVFERLQFADLERFIPEVEPIEGHTDPDATPDVCPEPVVRPGDLWICGKHRVLCSSCAEQDSYVHVLKGQHIDATITDPPYAIGLEYGSNEDTEENLAAVVEAFFPRVRAVSSIVAITPGVIRGWMYPQPDWQLCWFYGGGQFLSSWGFNCWQPVILYGKDPYLAKGKGARPDAVNMNTPANAADIDHPCPKPIPFWEWVMERVSHRGHSILDPFLGSGTTMIAAERLGRRCYGIEIEPKYVQVAIQRWAAFTGHDPVREDGRTFSELMKGAADE